MIKRVIKRDGRKTKFSERRVRTAVSKAMEEANENRYGYMEQVMSTINTALHVKFDDQEVAVEDIQDAIIEVLNDMKLNSVAEAFSNYREERDRVRETKSDVMKAIEAIGKETTRDNGNVGNNFSAKLLQIASVANKWYNLSQMPKEQAKFHESGDGHIHDLDSYNLTVNCLQIDLKELLLNGFNTGYGFIRPPKDIRSASALACIILQSSQNDMFGGQSFYNFDNDMAQAVMGKTRKIAEKEFTENKFEDGIIVLDIEKYRDKIENIINEKYVRPGMKAIVYNLNTMHSRAGAQVPFSGVNLGVPDQNATEQEQKDAATVCRIFLEEYERGLGKGEQPIFPNIVFRTKKEVNFNEEDPYYELRLLAERVAAKRMNPTFRNLDCADNLTWYEKGILASTMGCVDGDEVITYKISDDLYVESFERAYKRLMNIGIKHNSGKSEFIELNNVKIYDSKNGFVDCYKVIKNPDMGDWYKVTLSNGRVLVATSDHPLPVKDKGRTMVKNIAIEDKVPIIHSQYSEDAISENLSKSWLLGAILCDGCYSSSITSSFAAIGEDDIIEKYKAAIKEHFDRDVKIVERRRGVRGNYNDVIVIGDQIELRKQLANIFGGINKTSRQIPSEVFKWDRKSRVAFLAGMVDADGYINNNRRINVQIGSTNKELAIQTFALVQSLGIKSKIYINHYSKSDKRKERYRIEFPAFDDLIASMACKKKIDKVTKKSMVYSDADYAKVTKIEYLGTRNKESYDVTTKSDFFDVSGIYSHNCRTDVMDNVNGQCGPAKRGNIAPVTINLPRIGILAKGDWNKFYRLLGKRMELCKNILMTRYNVLTKLKVKDLPFTAGQKLILGSEELDMEDGIEPILKQGTWGIGFIGLAETLYAMEGKHHGQDDDVWKKGFDIIKHMREVADEYKNELKLNISLYATPAEGVSGRFPAKDKTKFGIIEGVNNKVYYTNSYHIPVSYNISVMDKMHKEGDFHALCNAGKISYFEIDGGTTDEKATYIHRSLNYAVNNTELDYIAYNFHIRHCKDCGCDEIDDSLDKCPKCSSRNLQGISRITGYMGLDERFGVGKAGERDDRIIHKKGALK